MRTILPPPDIPTETLTGSAALLHRDATQATVALQQHTETDNHTFTLLTKAREHYVVRIAAELVRLEQETGNDAPSNMLSVEVNSTILATGSAIERLGIPAVEISALHRLSREGNAEATNVLLRIHMLLGEYMTRVDRLRRRHADPKRQA